MEAENPKQSVGIEIVPPPRYTARQEEICTKLDQLHNAHGLSTFASRMFRGAIYVMQDPLQANPDRLAQAAHSLRDILYPLWKGDKISVYKKFGAVRLSTHSIDATNRLYGKLTELAHHGNGRGTSADYATYTKQEFMQLVDEFELLMVAVLSRQTDIHKEIESVLAQTPQP